MNKYIEMNGIPLRHPDPGHDKENIRRGRRKENGCHGVTENEQMRD